MQWPGNPIAREQQPILRKPSFRMFRIRRESFFIKVADQCPMWNILIPCHSRFILLPKYISYSISLKQIHTACTRCAFARAPASWSCRVLNFKCQKSVATVAYFSIFSHFHVTDPLRRPKSQRLTRMMLPQESR